MSIGDGRSANTHDTGESHQQNKKIEPYQNDRALVSKKQTTNMS